MTPHMEAIAFRIWQVAEPVGWDLTARDIANAIQVDPRVVGRVASEKGWSTRLRSSLTDNDGMWFDAARGAGLVWRGFDQ